MLLQRAALTSRAVIRPQAIPAHKCCPPRTPPGRTTGARLSAAGASLAAPAPLRILIVPALRCTRHSGDSQEEPADSKPAVREEQPAGSKAPAAFFGRELELGKLEELVERPPGVMRVVLGPRSSGKTAVLTEFQRTRQNVAAVNMRRITASTPNGFAKMLLLELARVAPRTAFEEAVQRLMAATATKQAGNTLMAFNEVVGGLVEGKIFAATMWGRLFTPNSQATQPQPQPLPGDDMGTPTQGIEALVDAWGAKNREAELQDWPVIVIDEANVLMEWTDKYPSQLAQLLRVLLRISKEANLCHVIMATWEWRFTSWLEQGIGYEFYQLAVIGDFPAEQAHAFFSLELQRRGIELEDATWEKVYEVGGGNAGFLHQLATQVPVLKPTNKVNWDTALADAVVPRWAATERHAQGGDALGWSKKQYAAAAEKLLRAQYHAVPRMEMAMLVGELAEGGGKDEKNDLCVGRQVLQKMVAANALAVRPLSSWARDVPMEAFVGVAEVVTAPSAVALHCMRQLLRPVEEDPLEATCK